MKLTTAFAVLAAFVLQWSASGQTAVVSSLGSRSCADVVSSPRDGDLGTEHYSQWLFGFLSGLNASRLRSHEKPFDLMDFEDADWQWVVRTCERNPQMTLFAAAAGLWNQLEAGRPPAPAQPFFPTSERARIVLPETALVLVVVEDAKHMAWFDVGPGAIGWEFLGPYGKDFERPSISREGCHILIDWGHRHSGLDFEYC